MSEICSHGRYQVIAKSCSQRIFGCAKIEILEAHWEKHQYSEKKVFIIVSEMSSKDYIKKAEALVKDNPYLMLSKSWCPDCVYANKVWESFGVASKIKLIELDKIEDKKESDELERAFAELSGRKWVPTIFFHGRLFGSEKDLKRWSSEGKLERILRNEGLIQ